jgi:hypothetical protein
VFQDGSIDAISSASRSHTARRGPQGRRGETCSPRPPPRLTHWISTIRSSVTPRTRMESYNTRAPGKRTRFGPPSLQRSLPSVTHADSLKSATTQARSGLAILHPATLAPSGSLSAISGTFLLSFQSSFHLSFTVLVRYRSPVSI